MAVAGLSLLAAAGCASWTGGSEDAIYRRAGVNRVEYLEAEVTRLRADLADAEDTVIQLESGLRGVHTRADAVSAVAEARIAVDQATGRAPWRRTQCEEARRKLVEAEAQIGAGHMGTAIFFASRARRIADGILGEARSVERAPDTLFVKSSTVNLRAGPSTEEPVLAVLTQATPVFEEKRLEDWVLVRTHAGRVGWVYASLLDSR